MNLARRIVEVSVQLKPSGESTGLASTGRVDDRFLECDVLSVKFSEDWDR